MARRRCRYQRKAAGNANTAPTNHSGTVIKEKLPVGESSRNAPHRVAANESIVHECKLCGDEYGSRIVVIRKPTVPATANSPILRLGVV
jgi:hypothetical protein